MAERNIVLDPPTSLEQDAPLRQAIERAERAEAELAALKSKHEGTTPTPNPTSLEHAADSRPALQEAAHALHAPALHGLEALRQDAMMRHLLESLDQGVDIGHYGRLVFAMVARHFLSQQEMLTELTKDRSFSEEQAAVLLAQVAERDYSPPRRERILEWQAQQNFVILPQPHDPDCGNVYRSLHFPQTTYEHIEEYQEERLHADTPA